MQAAEAADKDNGFNYVVAMSERSKGKRQVIDLTEGARKMSLCPRLHAWFYALDAVHHVAKISRRRDHDIPSTGKPDVKPLEVMSNC